VELIVGQASAAGTVNLVLTSNTGSTVTLVDGFQFVAPGSIALFVPPFGQFGTTVTAVGVGLLQGGNQTVSVLFGTTLALDILRSSDDEVVAVAPRLFAGHVNVTLVSDSGAFVVGGAVWEVREEGLIAAIVPGEAAFGALVTVTGSNLNGHNGSIVRATLGNTTLVVESQNQSFVVLRVTGRGAVSDQVRLIASSGAVVTGAPTLQVFEQGVVLTVLPPFGQAGTRVTLSGERLLSATDNTTLPQVFFNGVAVAAVVSAVDTAIVVELPSLPPSSNVSIRIRASNDGVVEVAGLFEVREEGVIRSVLPPTAQLGTLVSLNGTNLLAHAARLDKLLLNGSLLEIATQGDEAVTFITPRLAPGIYDVSLIAETGGTVRAAAALEILQEGVIQSVTPPLGEFQTQVTLRGERLLAGGSRLAKASLDGIDADLLFANDTTVHLRINNRVPTSAPFRLEADTQAVVVQSPNFTVVSSGIVFSLTPNSGQVGTRVALTGFNLSGVNSVIERVLLADVPCDVVTANSSFISCELQRPSALQLAAWTFPRTAAAKVISASGSVVDQGPQFTVLEEGKVFAVFPTVGAQGTRVGLSGARLLGGDVALASVTLAGVPADVLFATNDQVVVRARQSASTVPSDIILTARSGARVTLEDGWAYHNPASNVSIEPSFGHAGTFVEVRGSNLLGGGSTIVSATLAGIPASVVLANDTFVRLRAGPSPDGNGALVLTSNSGSFLESVSSLCPPPLTHTHTHTPHATRRHATRHTPHGGTHASLTPCMAVAAYSQTRSRTLCLDSFKKSFLPAAMPAPLLLYPVYPCSAAAP
jgi:hypothetical protein